MQINNPGHADVIDEPKAVIYEVNLAVDVDVVERFDIWLHKHTEEMLAIPGFISAATSVPDVEDEKVKHRCVQYRLSDQSALDNYFEHHAQDMRAKSLQHFDGHFTAERRVLSVAEAALAKQGVCANCDAELLGRFCSVCGQREEPRVPTIGSMTSEFTNEVFGVESKLWRSFRLLVFKPGYLTKAFLSGQRQEYMSPLRLYLLFSIITFAYFALLNNYGSLGVDINTAPENIAKVDVVDSSDAKVTSAIEDLTFNSGLFSEELDAQIGQSIKDSAASIRKDIAAGNKQAVLSKFFEPLPQALLLFLPIVALLFKLLYLGSGRYYVEHLIYVLHNHAFLFAVIILTTVSSNIVRVWPQFEFFIALALLVAFSLYIYRRLRQVLIEKFSKSKVRALLTVSVLVALFALLSDLTLTEGIGFLVGMLWLFYVPYYIYRSMLVVYERSWWVTMASLSLISMMYLFLLTIMLLASAAFVGYTYK